MTQCDKDFFPLNTVTRWDFKHFGGKFISRKNLNICLPFENKFQHRGKICLEYLSNKFEEFENKLESAIAALHNGENSAKNPHENSYVKCDDTESSQICNDYELSECKVCEKTFIS